MTASIKPSPPLIVTTNLPDAASAQKLAALLIEQRLAACVNILAPCLSVYRWQGKVEEATEVPLLIKTTSARYGALEAFIRTHHPYELPEIVAVPVRCGLAEYIAWVDMETAADSESSSIDNKPSC
jgi:periplasmic divalent cation tolerance protein